MNVWVSRLSLIVMLAVLTLPLSWCARNIWTGWNFTQMERAAQERYPIEYQALLDQTDEQVSAYPGWVEVLEEIDAIRPLPVLTLDQTYRAKRAFSLHTALIWRWDGGAFQPTPNAARYPIG